MSSKKKDQDAGLGDFITPIVDLLSILLIEGIKFGGKGLVFIFNRFIFNNEKEHELKKIERKQLDCKKITLDDDALGFSVNKKKNFKYSSLEKKKHTMIVGASGFGKTVLLDNLIYDDLKNDKPVIFIDPKGDHKSLSHFINLCRLTGRDFNIFSESYSGAGAISLNLTKDGSATHIADRIHYSFDWSEEHYETLCYRALKSAISSLKAEDQRVDFETILLKVKELCDPKSKDKEFSRKDVEGLIARLENIVQSDFGKKLSGEGQSISDIWNNGKCIYIGMPVLGYPKIARALGKIVLGDLSYAVYNKYCDLSVEFEKKLVPVGVYIDELSAVITNEFIELLNKCRGVKMELTFAFQSPSDINKVDPELCEQILENSSNWFILKQRMERGANLFSSAIGTSEGKKNTIRVKDGEEQDQGSQRAVEELLVHANLIKNLNPGQCILLRHGPTRIDLLNIKYIKPEIVSHNIDLLESEGVLESLPIVSTNKVIEEEIISKGGAL